MHNELPVFMSLFRNVFSSLLFDAMHFRVRQLMVPVLPIALCYSSLLASGSDLMMGNLLCPLIFIHLSSSPLFPPSPSYKCLSIIHVQVQHQLSLALA